MSQATSTEEKYAHIDEKDKQSVIEKVSTTQKRLENQTVGQSERAKDVSPVLTSAEIETNWFIMRFRFDKVEAQASYTPGSGTQALESDAPKNETPAKRVSEIEVEVFS